MVRVNFKKAAAIGIGCTLISTGTVWAASKDSVEWNQLLKAMIIKTNSKSNIVGVERTVDFERVEYQRIQANETLLKWHQDHFRAEGIHYLTDGNWMYVLVSAGERTTGGYNVEINSVTEVTQGKAYVHAVLTTPNEDDFVTQVLTYPNAVARFHKDGIEKVQGDLVSQSQQIQKVAKQAVEKLVMNFGKQLQRVSLLAPKEVVDKSMAESYGEFVSPSLLKKWQSDPQNAPGRMASSPWPDRIDILSIQEISQYEYEVKGEIIEITSMEQINGGIASKRSITLGVRKMNNRWIIDQVIVGEYEDIGAIVYKNTQYGFEFSLPNSWKDYSIVTDQWKGLALGDSQSGGIIETGLIIHIRHPKWTAENPRQDIPIMLFTLTQWESLQKETFHIGAAPIRPKELGRNSKYVFALPARYNYAFETGYEEVETILSSSPLKTSPN